MKKISECSPLEEVSLVLRLSDVQIKKTTTSVDYATMIAYDGVDKIEAKMWKFTDELREKLVSGEVYVVDGRMKDYQGKLQLNITSIRLVDENDHVDLDEFYEKAKLSFDDLAKAINEYFKKIDNEYLKNIVSVLLKKHFKDFFEFPGLFYPSGIA